MPVLNFPANPASQTPPNVYSPTSSPASTSNSVTYVWDGAKWESTGAAVPTIDYTYPGGVQQTLQERLEQYVNVADFGAVGDGVTNDTDAIQAAIFHIRDVLGGGTLQFENGKNYLLGPPTTQLYPQGDSLNYRLENCPSVNLQGNGCMISCSSNDAWIWNGSRYYPDTTASSGTTVSAQITSNVTQGEHTWTFDDASSFAVGDHVRIRFNDLPNDSTFAEVEWGYCDQITAISGNDITFSMPAFCDLDVNAVFSHSKFITKLFDPLIHNEISGIHFYKTDTSPTTSGRSVHPVRTYYGYSATNRDCIYSGVSFINYAYMRQSRAINSIGLYVPGRSDPQGGSWIGGYNNFRQIIKNASVSNFYRNVCFFESNNNAEISDMDVVDNYYQMNGVERKDESSNNVVYFYAQQQSKLTLDNITVSGDSGGSSSAGSRRTYTFAREATNGLIRFGNITINSTGAEEIFLNIKPNQFAHGFLFVKNFSCNNTGNGMLIYANRKKTASASLAFSGVQKLSQTNTLSDWQTNDVIITGMRVRFNDACYDDLANTGSKGINSIDNIRLRDDTNGETAIQASGTTDKANLWQEVSESDDLWRITPDSMNGDFSNVRKWQMFMTNNASGFRPLYNAKVDVEFSYYTVYNVDKTRILSDVSFPSLTACEPGTAANVLNLAQPAPFVRGPSAPTQTSSSVGDIVYNNAPTAGGYIGFVCVAAGKPGTWKGFGEIAA